MPLFKVIKYFWWFYSHFFIDFIVFIHYWTYTIQIIMFNYFIIDYSSFKLRYGVYSNTCLVIDRPNMIYPYMENGKPLSPESEENMKHPADNINKDIIPIFMERIYGGCENDD